MKILEQFSDKNCKRDYSSLLFELPELLTDNIISWCFDHVPNEYIFNSLNLGRELDIHITLIYGLHTNDYEDTEHLFRNQKPFKCSLGKMKLFDRNDKFDVLVIEVNCEELHELNSKMRINLEATESHPQYIPHVTIAYLRKGKGKQFIGEDLFASENFECNQIFFSSKCGRKTLINFGGKNE